MSTARLTAQELIATVLDEGSFESWDVPIPRPSGITPAYAADLDRARARTGSDEAVLTGQGRIQGHPIAFVVSEFGFLAGSVGVACANRIEAAVRRATADRLPLLAAPASGGTRMQEGTIAFLQMVRITAAIVDHKNAGLPYLVYLRHPTMGGVFASWGSLGHLTVGEPGALIGFLGPKVFEALHGGEFPRGVQLAENLAAHGVIDAVVSPADLAEIAAKTIGILTAPAEPGAVAAGRPIIDAPVWDSIETTREPRRPGIRRMLRDAASAAVPLFGTAEGEHQPGVVTALARIAGVSCVVVGQDRGAQRHRGPIGPGALRQVRRGIRLARELRLPLVTVIDTPGASLSQEAEEGGLSGEIARCLVDLLEVDAPVVSVLLGEGSGGGALALLPADRIIAAEHAWLAPLPPEGASAILHDGDTSFAPMLAELQGVAAANLAQHGVIDVVVSEGRSWAAFLEALSTVIAQQIAVASAIPLGVRLRDRSERFRVDA
ncbi:carboxyl transferase domain-containing protein [Gryllotalpicola reticulitermitis]|uniref:Carboxyl transferase domain-containing protein n=1 Tax=Gryllotalpicola reticulitermitis TaxID=1184153 RepID=A0ABV8Q1M1_9MICO